MKIENGPSIGPDFIARVVNVDSLIFEHFFFRLLLLFLLSTVILALVYRVEFMAVS